MFLLLLFSLICRNGKVYAEIVTLKILFLCLALPANGCCVCCCYVPVPVLPKIQLLQNVRVKQILLFAKSTKRSESFLWHCCQYVLFIKLSLINKFSKSWKTRQVRMKIVKSKFLCIFKIYCYSKFVWVCILQ